MSTASPSPPPTNETNAFFDAAGTGDRDRMRAMLGERPALAVATDSRCFGSTALVHAASAGDREMIDPLLAAAWRNRPEAAAALLDAGADLNARSGPLHRNEPVGWAIVSGAVEVLRQQLERGCTLRDVHREDAKAGAAGQFRDFNRTRPLDAWGEVERLIKSA